MPSTLWSSDSKCYYPKRNVAKIEEAVAFKVKKWMPSLGGLDRSLGSNTSPKANQPISKGYRRLSSDEKRILKGKLDMEKEPEIEISTDASSAKDEYDSQLLKSTKTNKPKCCHSHLHSRSKEHEHPPKKQQNRKKTEMCRNIVNGGHCPYGENCLYAHSHEELIKTSSMPSNYKTKICSQFHDPSIGYC